MEAPSDYQKELISNMLSLDFPGVADLRRQAIDFKVKNYDDSHNCGSFGIVPDSVAAKSIVDSPVPVEGISKDKTGTSVEFLLHVVDGYITELEIVVYSGIKLESPIAIDDIKFFARKGKSYNKVNSIRKK